MSNQENYLGNLLGNIFTEKNAEKLQNLLHDEETMKQLTNLASHIGSQFISCEIFNQMLDTNPKFTDEYLTEKINSFEKTHPDSKEIIEKYLRPYQENRDSEKPIYQFRRFLQSGDCKKALDDQQVKKYLQELLNSPEFQEKLQQIQKKN